jgi:hypothetical protein
MGHFLVAISRRTEDIQLGIELAAGNNLTFAQTVDLNELRRILVEKPGSVVLWDGDDPTHGKKLLEILPKYIRAGRLFVVTDLGLGNHREMLKLPVFGHHLYRRFHAPAPDFYTKLVQTAYVARPEGLQPFFADQTVRKIQLNRSGQKYAAIEAIQKVLTQKGVSSRIAGLAAQATDELILNALFHAPVDSAGRRIRRHRAREDDFELEHHETITVEFAANPGYMGISVRDRYGSLSKHQVYRDLQAHLQPDGTTIPSRSQALGFGLSGIVRSGLSLFILSKPRTATEAMIFVPILENFRMFRRSFRFFSLLMSD